MGYYTRFNMEVVTGDYLVIDDIIAYMKKESDEKDSFYPFKSKLEELSESCGISNSFHLDDTDEAKWYERDNEMKRLSIKFPNVLFKLHGCEDIGDSWNAYYKNGKKKYYKAQKMIPTFNDN